MTFASAISFMEKECFVTSNKTWCGSPIEAYSQFLPLGTITPFMISGITDDIGTAYLCSASTGYVANVTSILSPVELTAGLVYQQEVSYSPSTSVSVRASILTVGGTTMTIKDYVAKHGPVFYLILINPGSQPFLYSDNFMIKDIEDAEECMNCDPYCILAWTSDCNIGSIPYKDYAINNKVYLSTAISKPAYEYKDIGSEDGLGKFYPSFQRLEKIYKIEANVNEGLADAMALIPIHGSIVVTDHFGKNFNPSQILVDVSWTDDCMAKVEVSMRIAFNTRTICC